MKISMRQHVKADEFDGYFNFSPGLPGGPGVLIFCADQEPNRFVHVYMSTVQIKELHRRLGEHLAHAERGQGEG